jgi:hypothetical protein
VKAHVTVVLRKLGVFSRTQAVVAARSLFAGSGAARQRQLSAGSAGRSTARRWLRSAHPSRTDRLVEQRQRRRRITGVMLNKDAPPLLEQGPETARIRDDAT